MAHIVFFTLLYDEPKGHRLYTGTDGHLYVADRSGATPCSTSTGPLRLLSNYRIQEGRVYWQVLQLDTGHTDLTVSLSMPVAIEAAKFLGTEITVRGDQLPLADVLEAITRIY
jgi:hypothetical protein